MFTDDSHAAFDRGLCQLLDLLNTGDHSRAAGCAESVIRENASFGQAGRIVRHDWESHGATFYSGDLYDPDDASGACYREVLAVMVAMFKLMAARRDGRPLSVFARRLRDAAEEYLSLRPVPPIDNGRVRFDSQELEDLNDDQRKLFDALWDNHAGVSRGWVDVEELARLFHMGSPDKGATRAIDARLTRLEDIGFIQSAGLTIQADGRGRAGTKRRQMILARSLT